MMIHYTAIGHTLWWWIKLGLKYWKQRQKFNTGLHLWSAVQMFRTNMKFIWCQETCTPIGARQEIFQGDKPFPSTTFQGPPFSRPTLGQFYHQLALNRKVWTLIYKYCKINIFWRNTWNTPGVFGSVLGPWVPACPNDDTLHSHRSHSVVMDQTGPKILETKLNTGLHLWSAVKIFKTYMKFLCCQEIWTHIGARRESSLINLPRANSTTFQAPPFSQPTLGITFMSIISSQNQFYLLFINVEKIRSKIDVNLEQSRHISIGISFGF